MTNSDRREAALAEHLAEWNALADELAQLHARLRSGSWVGGTVAAACHAWNDTFGREKSIARALVRPGSGRLDRAGGHVRVLQRSVETLRVAVVTDPNRRGPRGPFILDGPDLRLPDTIAGIRADRRKQLEGRAIKESVDA